MQDLIEKIKKTGLKGEITIPADKSISHRSLIFGALVNSAIKITNLSKGFDCISTLRILEKLGVKHKFINEKDLILDSSNSYLNQNINEIKEYPCEELILDCTNSGTTTRLLCGLFARSCFKVKLIGDESLSKRPMKRVIEPLSLMGAQIESNDNKLPLRIKGKSLKAIEYFSPLASAQIKSCLILAGLGIEDKTIIIEPTLSRNHSELMLEYLNAEIESGQCDINKEIQDKYPNYKTQKAYYTKIKKSKLTPKDIEIPGDISSAAFFMVAAAIIPNSRILIKNVGINPTRIGILDVFKQAQVKFELLNKKTICNEEVCDIEVEYSPNLKPFEIKGALIPRLIDEIPILAILASTIKGESIVKDAQDLRNKESDRIATIVDTFKQLNIEIKENQDGFIIKGQERINKQVNLKTHLDHRLAMSYFVLSLINEDKTTIENFDCTNTSFPEFLTLFNQLTKR